MGPGRTARRGGAARSLGLGVAKVGRAADPAAIETRRGAEQFQRILEALARVELTDGLTFPQLVSETMSRLPRDATVVAVLPDVPVETALTLGMLKRAGYAVTVVLVMYDTEEHYLDCMGRLLAENIDVRRVEDEAMLAALCSRQMVGA